MMVKGLGIFILVLIMGIALLGIASSLVYDCQFRPISECNYPFDNIVLRISDTGNAHGEAVSGTNYTHAVCCNYTGSPICDGTNSIIRLSDTSNAHAEIPWLSSTYSGSGIEVCYENLSCINTPSNCPPDTHPIDLMSVSFINNSHLGDIADYLDYKICCNNSAEPTPQTCSQLSGYFCVSPFICYPNDERIFASDNNATHDCCSDQIYCCDQTDPCVAGVTCGNWTKCGEIFECGGCSAGSVCVNGRCDDWDVFWDTPNDNQTVIENTVVDIYVIVNESYDGITVNFEVLEDSMGTVSDQIKNPDPAMVDDIGDYGLAWTQWVAEYYDDSGDDGNPPEYYIVATVQGEPPMDSRNRGERNTGFDIIWVLDDPWDCGEIVYCEDYDQARCDGDPCFVGNASVALHNNGKGCGSSYCGDTRWDDYRIYYDRCNCSWDSVEQKCGPTKAHVDCDNPGFIFGNCTDIQDDENKCDQPPVGLFSISWHGEWEWGHDGNSTPGECAQQYISCNISDECVLEVSDGLYYCDPTNQSVACRDDKKKSAPCPAGTKLPFFNKYNLIIAIIAIYAIYGFLTYRRKAKKVL